MVVATHYSDDLMQEILRLRRKGYTIEQISVELGPSMSAIQKWIMWGRGGATIDDRARKRKNKR
jgi:hypothetical protein